MEEDSERDYVIGRQHGMVHPLRNMMTHLLSLYHVDGSALDKVFEICDTACNRAYKEGRIDGIKDYLEKMEAHRVPD